MENPCQRSGDLDFDAFPAGPNLREYVPHRACEASIAYLAAKLIDRACIVAICGECGTGRTLWLRALLRLLAEHFEPVYVPSGAWSPAETQAWISAHAPRWNRRRLAIGVDDATNASEELLEWLAARAATDGARVILILEDRGRPLSPMLRNVIATRVFTESLSLAEAVQHVATRAERAREALPIDLVARLVLSGRGNLGAIHRLGTAELVLQAASSNPGAAGLAQTRPAQPGH